MDIKQFSQEQKIDMIFQYLFAKGQETSDDFFWNTLTKSEIHDLEKIEKEDFAPFEL